MAVGEMVVTVIFKRQVTGNLVMLQKIYTDNKNWIYCIFPFSFSLFTTVSGGLKGGRVNLGGMGKEYDQGALYKICK